MRLVFSVSPHPESRTSAHTLKSLDHNTPPCCLGSATLRRGTQVPKDTQQSWFERIPHLYLVFLKNGLENASSPFFSILSQSPSPFSRKKKRLYLTWYIALGYEAQPCTRVIGNIQDTLRTGITLMNRYQPPFQFRYFPNLCFQQNQRRN